VHTRSIRATSPIFIQAALNVICSWTKAALKATSRSVTAVPVDADSTSTTSLSDGQGRRSEGQSEGQHKKREHLLHYAGFDKSFASKSSTAMS